MHGSMEHEQEPSLWYRHLLLALAMVFAAATFVVLVLPQPSTSCDAAQGCLATGADGAMEAAITRMRELPADRTPRILRGAPASSGAKGRRDP